MEPRDRLHCQDPNWSPSSPPCYPNPPSQPKPGLKTKPKLPIMKLNISVPGQAAKSRFQLIFGLNDVGRASEGLNSLLGFVNICRRGFGDGWKLVCSKEPGTISDFIVF